MNAGPDLRFARLSAGVRGLGGRGRGIETDRILLIAGSVALPLGLIVILIGWYGASHTPWLFEQIPYVISGGILGGALVIAGGFFYFGYWLTRLVQESREQTRQLVEALARVDGRLEAIETAPRGAAAAPAALRRFVATTNGTMYHRSDCAIVANKPGLRAVRADLPGLKPCRICEPDLVLDAG